jgi:acetolactate synthase-1/2/3 large subunit
MMRLGAEVICDALHDAGATVVFGMPGSQNVDLFDALGASPLRTVVTTHEMAAAFAAVGFYRSSGRVGVVTTIPGPGFTFATTGLAEAAADSAGILHIVPASNDGTGRPYQFQDIDQVAIARTLAKDVLVVDRIDDLAPAIARGYELAGSGEPGPVVVVIARELFRAPSRATRVAVASKPAPPSDGVGDELVRDLVAAGRIALIVGQGGQGHGASVRMLADRLNAAVLTTSSGRGVISEEDPRSLYFDFALGGGTSVNRLLETCDLVLALGCKFTHNGTGAFILEIPPDKLIRVDASSASLRGRYPARFGIEADLGTFLDSLLAKMPQRSNGWTHDELGGWRTRLRAEQDAMLALAPTVRTDPPVSCRAWFEAFQSALPADAIVVTDSGLHQGLTRGFMRVRSERGLIVPADFQSMGFGVPVAIGARIANPQRQVALIIGDGGMSLSGLELLTAVRERLDLTVVVFNDGQLGSIRRQQIWSVGRSHGVAVQGLDLAAFAGAIGARYRRLDADLDGSIRASLASPGVNILDVAMADKVGSVRDRLLGTARRFKRGRRLRRR